MSLEVNICHTLVRKNWRDKEKEMQIKIYGKENCPWCDKAKEFLDLAKIEYQYIDINEPGAFDFVTKTLGAKTVPAILINEEFIGGYTQLIEKAKE